MTAVAGMGEIGEARVVSSLDSAGKRDQWLLDHVNLVDGNVLIEPRGIDAVFCSISSIAVPLACRLWRSTSAMRSITDGYSPSEISSISIRRGRTMRAIINSSVSNRGIGIFMLFEADRPDLVPTFLCE